jgi:hypothetical protein
MSTLTYVITIGKLLLHSERHFLFAPAYWVIVMTL